MEFVRWHVLYGLGPVVSLLDDVNHPTDQLVLVGLKQIIRSLEHLAEGLFELGLNLPWLLGFELG